MVPSLTEVLSDLDLEDETLGITKFCVHPPAWKSQKTIIGGTKKFNHEVVDTLKPNLVIANKEENELEAIELLQKKYSVYVTDIKTVADCCQFINDLGILTKKVQHSERLTNKIEKAIASIQPLKKLRKALYAIWKSPWMFAGNDTFIHEMLLAAGFQNCIEAPRYPTLNPIQIKEHKPDVLMLSSEPYPFKGEHIQELSEILPETKIILVDGEIFSWYGSRLLHAPAYINSIIRELETR